MITAQHAKCQIDAYDKSLSVFPIGYHYVHFTVSGSEQDYRLSCCRQNILQVGPILPHDKAKDFERFVLPSTEKLGPALPDSITHDLATETGKLRLKNLLNQLTEAWMDTSPYTT
jgi:hypothetical protein